MPLQTIEDFAGCDKVRVSIPNAVINSDIQIDSEGLFFLVDRPVADKVLRIEVNNNPGGGAYSGFSYIVDYIANYQQVFEEGIVDFPESGSRAAYGSYRFSRAVTTKLPHSGGFNTRLRVYGKRLIWDWVEDANGNETYQQVWDERAGSAMFIDSVNTYEVVYAPSGIEGVSYTLTDYLTTSNHRIETNDGRRIDPATGEIVGSWEIVVSEIDSGNATEIKRITLTANPGTLTAQCLSSVCEENCVPTYNASGAHICICGGDAKIINETDDYEYQPYHHNQKQMRLDPFNL